MTGDAPLDIQSPLRTEMLRFVKLRWCAGFLVIVVPALYAMLTEWSREITIAIAIGLVILAYNLAFRLILPRTASGPRVGEKTRLVIWLQLVLDLISLAALTTLTGGVASPVIGFFVLHMVFSSLLLNPPRAYAAAVIAITIEALALTLSDQWPASFHHQLMAIGWGTTLVLTVFLTNHTMSSIRRRDLSLLQSHQYIDAILRTAADGIITSNGAGRIESANPAVLRMFQYSNQEMLELGLDDLLRTERSERSDPNDPPEANADNGPPTTPIPDVLHGVRKDRSVFLAEEAHSDTEFASGRLRISIIRDITTRLESELKVRQLNTELNKHQRHLIQHEKMIAIGQLASGIAHEIANPLSNMDSLIQLARLKPELMRKNTPELLGEQVMRITRIVQQLKDFAHPGDSEWTDVPIDRIIENSLKYVRLDRRHREIDIHSAVQTCDPPCVIHAQPQLLEQVLINVLTNAIDAVADIKSPSISIQSRCVDRSHCQLTIQDNGPGIRADHIDRVFEPFFTTKPVGYGTGLGLSISHQLIARHGGTIEILSEEGQGATVRITLPLADDPSQPQEHPV